jgi:hypothetical protein
VADDPEQEPREHPYKAPGPRRRVRTRTTARNALQALPGEAVEVLFAEGWRKGRVVSVEHGRPWPVLVVLIDALELRILACSLGVRSATGVRRVP